MIDSDLVLKLAMGRLDVIVADPLDDTEYVKHVRKMQRRMRWKQNVALAKIRKRMGT